MSERTSNDTGRDCAHCGGHILLYQEEKDNMPWSYYECADCGCQWTLTDELFHIGRLTACQRLTPPAEVSESVFSKIPPPVWVLIGTVLILVLFPPVTALLIRLGIYLFSVLRWLALPITIGLLVWGGYILGKRQEWW
jgi:DNA-directed RNA polymerase subunit RPC12/RpoP